MREQVTETEIQLSRELNKIPRWDWNRSSSILHPRSEARKLKSAGQEQGRREINSPPQFSWIKITMLECKMSSLLQVLKNSKKEALYEN